MAVWVREVRGGEDREQEEWGEKGKIGGRSCLANYFPTDSSL